MRKLFTALRDRAVAYRLQVLIGGGALLLLVFIGTVYAILNPKPHGELGGESNLPPVTLTSSYSDGTHTIAGSIELKNRCQRLDASAMLDESVTPAIIRVDLTSDDDEGICLEIPETRSFSISVEADESAEIQVFVNGLPLNGDAV